MGVKVNEIKTLFTLDAKNFDKAVKNAERSVENIKKEFESTQKQVDQLKKALDKVDKFDMDVDTDDIKKAVKELEQLEEGLKKASEHADGLLDGLSEGVDLKTFDKLEKMLKSMSDIDIIDLRNLQKAERQIDKMLSDLKQDVVIGAKLDVDDSNLRNLETQIDVLVNAKGSFKDADGGLRHWIDNNGADTNQAADDTHKVLQDILSVVKSMTQSANEEAATQQELNTKNLEASTNAMAEAVKNSNNSIKDLATSMGDGVQRTGEYVNEMVRIRENMKDIGFDKELLDLGDMDIPEAYEDAFETVEEAIKRIKEQMQGLFDEFENINVDNYDDLEKVINRIQGAQNELGEQSLNWVNSIQKAEEAFNQTNQELAKTEEKIEDIKKEIDSINTDALNGAMSAQDATARLTALGKQTKELEEQRKALQRRANEEEAALYINKKVTDELKQQSTKLEQARIEQSKNIKDLREAKRKQEEITKELKEQEDAAKKTQKSFENLAEALDPLLSATGLDKFIDSFKTLKGVTESGQKGLKGLSEAFKLFATSSTGAAQGSAKASAAMATLKGAAALAGPALAAVAAALVAIVVPIASVVAGFKALKTVLDNTLPEFIDMEQAITKVAAAMRLSGEAYYELSEAFKDGFASQGYTQDVNEYADALMRVKQQLEGLAEFDYGSAELALKDVLTISSITGYDPNEIVRSARNMAINFGEEVSSVLDMMMSAYQKTGDPMNDLLDTMQEYPSQFKKMGVSAEFFYDLLTRGSEAGVYNTDKIADTFKELYLRISEGADDASAELLELGYSMEDIARAANATDDVIAAFDQLGISVNSFKEEIAKGGKESETAIYGLVDAISKVEDKAAQQQIIANLFGSPGEDLGSHFFEVLAEGEIAVGEFAGAVSEAGQMMESTLGYQVDELKNKFTALKAEIADSFGVVLKQAIMDINDNFDQVKQAVETNLIPALEMLGFALVDPFIDGKDSAVDFIVAVIEGISSFIEGFAMFINVCNGVIAILRVIGNGVEVVWNLCQIVVESLAALALGVVQMIGNIITRIIDGVYNLVTDFDTSCKNMGIAWSNFCTGIHNTFGRAVADIQKLAAGMINGIIEGLNAIPGVDISYRAKWGSGYSEKSYKEYLPYENGLNLTGKFNDYMSNEFDFLADRISGNVDDLFKDIGDIGDAFSDFGKTFTFTKRFDEMKAKLESLKTQQKEVDKKQEQINNKVQPQKNNNILGDNIKQEDMITDAKKEQAELDKKKNELKDKETELQKELNELLKQEQELQKEIFEAMKRQIQLEKDYAADRRSWEEAIYEQQVKLIDDKKEALLYEIAMIEQIRQSYVLTAEEQISYQQKQFDLALSLRDYYLDQYKDSIQKEIDAVKNRAKEELKIEKNKNDKLIKDKERQIKAIEALMRENEYNDEQDDLDYEIKKTEEELQKYLYATSFEGISKRNELEEELRELRLEKERAQKKKELEDKKQALEDEIDDIKDANEEAEKAAEEKAEAMEKIYDDMFDELEKVMNAGMLDIGKIQELAQKETNSTIKTLLNDMVADYQNALKLVEKYTLNMKDILGWNTNDAIGDIIEGTLTGDSDKVNDGKDTIDKDKNWQPGLGSNASESAFKQAQNKYNSLKKEYTSLGAKKVKTDADKKRMKEIEQEVAELRKVWGFTGYQDTSSFKAPTSTQQAVSNSISGIQNQINALSTASAARMIDMPTYDIPNYSLPSYDNSVNPQALRMDNVLSNAPTAASYTEVNNNSGPLLAIETFNNNSNADVRKLAYEMNANLSIKNRSKGKRK